MPNTIRVKIGDSATLRTEEGFRINITFKDVNTSALRKYLIEHEGEEVDAVFELPEEADQ